MSINDEHSLWEDNLRTSMHTGSVAGIRMLGRLVLQLLWIGIHMLPYKSRRGRKKKCVVDYEYIGCPSHVFCRHAWWTVLYLQVMKGHR